MPAVPSCRSIALIAVAATLMLAVSCGDTPDHSVAGYCSDVKTNLAAINAPSIATPADIATTLDLYRNLGQRAPAAVAPEWQTMIDSLETAATLVPGDPDQMTAVNEAALSSQSAATRIQQYTKDTCGADIGTPPLPTNPVTVTTIAPPVTT